MINVSNKESDKYEDGTFQLRFVLWCPITNIAFTSFGDGYDIGCDFEF